ncbi:MAG: ankyrin repeat domain-containing protein [Alphaproteobacteria bacterium]|nr:ankyrin repeat domain-containing protein [Alphaproteobacteria bacterium]
MSADDAEITIDEKFSNLIAQGDLATMMSFPDLPARVQARDDEGWTPLHWAALYGHADCAGFLIAHGAPVDAQSHRGETPLMIAAESRQKSAFAVLLAAGAREDLTRENGDTAASILREQKADDFLSVLRDALAERSSVLQKAVSVLPSPTVRKRLN